RDAGGQGELTRPPGGVAVAHDEALAAGRMHDDAQAARAGIGPLVLDGSGVEVLDGNIGERAHRADDLLSLVRRGNAEVTKSAVWPCPAVSGSTPDNTLDMPMPWAQSKSPCPLITMTRPDTSEGLRW